MAVLIDRIPTKPNRRKLTFEDDNSVRYAKIEMADEPIEPGNGFNKQNVIDTAKLMYGVGDIVSTMRADLGNNWLLANGANFDPATYPDLATLMGNPISATTKWKTSTTLTAAPVTIAYGNGYWVAASANNIFYKAGNPVGDWALISFPTGTDIKGVYYGNGYWVAVGVNGTTPKMFYRSSTPNGQWTENATAFGSYPLNDVIYSNGYWVACANYSAIFYKVGTPDGTWTLHTNGLGNNLMSIAYGNGWWVATTGMGNPGQIRHIAGNPDGAWNSTNIGTTVLYKTAYGNGYWVTTGNNHNLYYRSDTPAGTWTQNNPVTSTGTTVGNVSYVNGYWFVVMGSKLYYQASVPTGSWTEITLTPKPISRILYADNFYVGYTGSQITYKTYTLPTIANEAHNYIKALP